MMRIFYRWRYQFGREILETIIIAYCVTMTMGFIHGMNCQATTTDNLLKKSLYQLSEITITPASQGDYTQ